MNTKRTIQAIAPFLADDFVDLDKPIFNTDEYSNILNQNSARLVFFSKYLICKLHDSRVIDITQVFDKLTIVLSDFSTYVFADALIDKFELAINLDDIFFPLSIEFSGELNVEYNSVDEHGFLHRITSVNLDEYLYEQVTKIDDKRIEFVFHFWKSNLKDNKPGERVILIVSAQELTLNQDEAWNQIFGNKFNDYYEYFKEQFNSDRYVSDHHECVELINEYEQQKIDKYK
jgi:hypothetical protein